LQRLLSAVDVILASLPADPAADRFLKNPHGVGVGITGLLEFPGSQLQTDFSEIVVRPGDRRVRWG
jgi:hypothetical protein